MTVTETAADEDRQHGLEHCCLFDTAIGPCGVAWSERGVTRLQLPERDRKSTEQRLKGSSAVRFSNHPPPPLKRFISMVQRYLAGQNVDFSSVVVDVTGASAFEKAVYRAARSVGRGETASYGELAERAGFPGAARAVGRAMARNPIAIVIPCHRILAAGHKIGGFSAYGGATAKQHLLALEGVSMAGAAKGRTSSLARLDLGAVTKTLAAADPALGRVIHDIGPFTLAAKRGGTSFAHLADAIVYQQLTNAAAATISKRLRKTLGGKVTPEAILHAEDQALASSGLSRSKIAALRDLASKALDGTVPSLRAARLMTDEEIVARLTAVKGIGPWTAQMFLIFSLQRTDVLPADDYGLRRGFQIAFRTHGLPTPERIEERAERWRPYRTIASWYLWRVAERSRQRAQSRSGS